MASVTAIPIVNAALTRTGDDPITAFDEGTTQAGVAAANYDEIVNAILSGYPWKFASRTMALAPLDVTVDLPWQFAYQVPSDLLDLRCVEVDGHPIDYELMSDKILALWGPPDTPIAKYTYRLEEPYWPKYFRGAVIAALEPVFLRSIGERYSEAEARDKRAIGLLAVARNRDSQSQTPRQPVDSPILRARHGFWSGGPMTRSMRGCGGGW